MVHEIEDFYGVYLLYCLNPKYKGRTYIGYTVDPNRRIKQHNTGHHAGGAFRTSGRGPWEMVLIIHGFPNDVSGLRFEWAWQHPDKSRRLREVAAKSRKESAFQYRWRVVCNMLRTAPWCGLSLTVRWLKQDFRLDFPSGLEPPLHMPVVYGPVVSKKLKTSNTQRKTNSGTATSSKSGTMTLSQSGTATGSQSGTAIGSQSSGSAASVSDIISSSSSQKMCIPNVHNSGGDQLLYGEMRNCSVCYRLIKAEAKTLTCLKPDCSMIAHIICLAENFLSSPSELLPVEGRCPRCKINLLWGELVRYRKGCSRNLSQSVFQPDGGEAEGSLPALSEGDENS